MKKNNLLINFFFYFFFIYIFIIFTNTHFNFQDSLQFGGADGFSYMSISKDSPFFTTEKMMSIHSERFFFPYIIGLVSKLIKIDIYILYKFFVFIILIIINVFTIKILMHLKLNFQTILIFLTLINLNPYITRFYISIPTIINDLIFVAGVLVITEKIIVNNNKFFIVAGYIFSFASRQTSIALIIGYLISFFIKGKKLINLKFELIGLFFFVGFIALNFYYSSNTIENMSSRHELYSPKMRILGFFVQNVPLKEKLIFLVLPLLSFFPLLFFLLLSRKLKYSLKQILNSKVLVFLFSFVLLVAIQPILSGVEVTGRNILRLTSLAYIPFLIFTIMITKQRKNFLVNNNYFFIIMIIVSIFHSFHPTFSKIPIFDVLRF